MGAFDEEKLPVWNKSRQVCVPYVSLEVTKNLNCQLKPDKPLKVCVAFMTL